MHLSITKHSRFFLLAILCAVIFVAPSCDSVKGCTDPNDKNYKREATEDDGTCAIYYGCMDQNATNYDEVATKNKGCIYILGCMDPFSKNYNPLATKGDGTCIY